MNILVIIFILCTPICVYSQDSTDPILFSNPVSPKAFEFLKYGEIPVSNYTGTPNISIPVYTIEAKGISLPIFLSYHANGIRVIEESSWVGLGWSLNITPTLTQVVNGFDDFNSNLRPNDLELERMITELTDLTPTSVLSGCDSKPNFNVQRGSHFGGEPYPYFHFDPELMFGRRDAEPDIFKFDIMGYSGEIVMDWNTGIFFCLNDPRIKIILGNSNEFRVQTPEGHLFHFSNVEVTNHENWEQYPNYAGQITPIGAYGNLVVSRNYNIDYIITNNGEVINFDYHPSQVTKNVPTQNVTHIATTPFPCLSPGGIINGPPPELNLGTKTVTSSIQTKQNQFYLKEVSWPNGKIKFNSLLDRTDLNNSRRLTDLTIYSRNPNDPIKNFHFENNDYFIGNDDSEVIVFPFLGKTLNELTQRLRLNAVIETKTPLGSYTNMPSYNFEYHSFDDFPRKDCKPNEWGLVNSQSTELVKAGILKSIGYPTKGKTTFDYEPHEFTNYGGSTNSYSSYGQEQFLRVQSYGNAGTSNQSLNMPNINAGNKKYSYSAVLSVLADGPCASSAYNPATNLYSIKAQVKKYKYNPATGYFNITVFDEMLQASSASPNAQYLIEGILEADEYLAINTNLLVANGCQINSDLPHSYADVSITYRTVANIEKLVNSGLRIQRINSYDVNESLVLSKEYNYSEGRMMSPLIKQVKELKDAFYISGPYNGVGIGTHYDCQYEEITTTSSTYYPISSNASGKHIGYDWVEEIQGSSILQENGKIKYHFENIPDLGVIEDDQNTYTNHYYRKLFPLEKSYPANGSILKVEVFSKDNFLLKETTNTYITSSNDNKCVYARKSTYRDAFSQSAHNNEIVDVYMIGYYPVKFKNTFLSSSIEKEYSPSGIISKKSVFLYDNKQQVKEKITTNSKGDQITVKYKYPYNLSAQHPYNHMTDFNFLTPVVEEQTFVNSQQVSLLRYSHFFLSINYFGTYPLLNYSRSKGSNNQLEEVVNYTYYDDGNIKAESRGNSNKNTYFIWGYNGQYPIAIIENFTSNQAVTIDSLINVAVAASNMDHNALQGNGPSENTLRNALSALRDHSVLSNALMTSYTYDPLVGLTSITDERGQTVYYEYDDLNRLKHIRDAEGNLVTKNEYNYKL